MRAFFGVLSRAALFFVSTLIALVLPASAHHHLIVCVKSTGDTVYYVDNAAAIVTQ